MQLTPEEYERLQHHLKVVGKRAHNNPNRCTPETELEIIEKLKAHWSNGEIIREMKVCEQTINSIRRRNGLWGV